MPTTAGAAVRRCEALLQTTTIKTLIPSSTKRTLLRLLHSELRFLSHLPPSSPVSSNVGYLEAVVRTLEIPLISKISRVCKPVPTLAPPVHVDVICTLGRRPAWLLVSDRNPRNGLWVEKDESKGIRAKVGRVVAAARAAGALRPEVVVLFFYNGVGEDVVGNLVAEFGASEIEDVVFVDEEVEGGWVNVVWKPARVFELEVGGGLECCGGGHGLQCGGGLRMNGCGEFGFDSVVDAMVDDGMPVNFDTTALIALVSGISNGGTRQLLNAPEAEMRRRFKGNYEFVMAQVQSELEEPILKKLKPMIAGKRGIICESVRLEFMELISMCGGPEEARRADYLLKALRIVPDHPSDRVKDLPTSRKIAEKNKIVFGTGDYWHAPTLTANMGFVRAISQTGMSLLTFEHRPRALTGD